MAGHHIPWISPEEFLDREAVSPTKHTYYRGVVVPHGSAMPVAEGWETAQERLTANLLAAIRVGLGVGSAAVDHPSFVDKVVSPLSASADRGAKARAYRADPVVRQYVLLAVDTPWVEIQTRCEDGTWLVQDVAGLEPACAFSEIDCVVPMARLYEGVLAP